MPEGVLSRIVVYRTINCFWTWLDVIPVPAWTREIVFASDAFRDLMPRLDAALKRHYAQVKADPTCMELVPSTKGVVPGNISYDDMAYLRIGI